MSVIEIAIGEVIVPGRDVDEAHLQRVIRAVGMIPSAMRAQIRSMGRFTCSGPKEPTGSRSCGGMAPACASI